MTHLIYGRSRNHSFIKVVLLISLPLVSCRTNTVFDALTNESEFRYEYVSEDDESLALCTALEEKGYVLDELRTGSESIIVTYPDGHQQLFPTSKSVTFSVIIDIERNFDNTEQISKSEIQRLKIEAQQVCLASKQTIDEASLDEIRVSGILLWDYIVGVRIPVSFSDDCQVSLYSVSTGGYGHSYKLESDVICPSGHVDF